MRTTFTGMDISPPPSNTAVTAGFTQNAEEKIIPFVALFDLATNPPRATWNYSFPAIDNPSPILTVKMYDNSILVAYSGSNSAVLAKLDPVGEKIVWSQTINGLNPSSDRLPIAVRCEKSGSCAALVSGPSTSATACDSVTIEKRAEYHFFLASFDWTSGSVGCYFPLSCSIFLSHLSVTLSTASMDQGAYA